MSQSLTIILEDKVDGVKYTTSFSHEECLGAYDELFRLWITDHAWEAIGFSAVKKLFNGGEDEA